MKAELIKFLKSYPSAEYMTDELIAYDVEGNEIAKLDRLPERIRDYFETSTENYQELEGAEIVEGFGGYKFALDEIKSEL